MGSRFQIPLPPKLKRPKSIQCEVHRQVDTCKRDLLLRSAQACPWETGLLRVAMSRRDSIWGYPSMRLRLSRLRTRSSTSLHPRVAPPGCAADSEINAER